MKRLADSSRFYGDLRELSSMLSMAKGYTKDVAAAVLPFLKATDD